MSGSEDDIVRRHIDCRVCRNIGEDACPHRDVTTYMAGASVPVHPLEDCAAYAHDDTTGGAA